MHKNKNIKKCIFTFLFFSINFFVLAQEAKNFDVYKPSENAAAEIQKAVAKASKENKHVLIQVGGNWCSWCARFHKAVTTDRQVDSLIKSSFVVYHLNYSKENKNLKTLAKYSFPQRFGFPVFLILAGNGKLIHTQNSAYLEEGEGYSKEKIIDFLSAWTREALNPAAYKEE
jgi:thioredoxin-related protein